MLVGVDASTRAGPLSGRRRFRQGDGAGSEVENEQPWLLRLDINALELFMVPKVIGTVTISAVKKVN
jgi:hypothetical protein